MTNLCQSEAVIDQCFSSIIDFSGDWSGQCKDLSSQNKRWSIIYLLSIFLLLKSRIVKNKMGACGACQSLWHFWMWRWFNNNNNNTSESDLLAEYVRIIYRKTETDMQVTGEKKELHININRLRIRRKWDLHFILHYSFLTFGHY